MDIHTLTCRFRFYNDNSCFEMKDIKDYSLFSHNTFGIKAKCDRFIEFNSVEEIVDTLKSGLTEADQPLLLLGGGSNLLLTGDYHGTVLHSAIHGREITDKDSYVLLRCGSGETWDDVVAFAVANNWHGMENLSLIPGEVGASAIQNIGAYGAEAKDIIEKVEAVEIATGKQVSFKNADCGYLYRQSKFKNEWRNKYFITYVTYRLSRKFTPILDYGNIRSALSNKGISVPSPQQLRQTIIEIRQSKLPDPKIEGNAGSFFMNPIVGVDKFKELSENNASIPHYVVDADHIKVPAGWLIEQCGWKGKTIGRVGVYPKQSLVLVNKGGATGKEVLDLCNAIRKDVSRRFDVDIKPEVNII